MIVSNVVEPVVTNVVKPEVKPKTTTTTPKPKDVTSNSGQTVPIIKNTPSPKEEVVVNTPEPSPVVTTAPPIYLPQPVTQPKPVEPAPTTTTTTTNWTVPANYKSMKNPTDVSDKDNLAVGKSLYTKHCASCHGKNGLGDASKASELSGDLGDFSSAKFQKQTDGELFYKITDGKNDMPSFKKKLTSDEDRWLVVNYLRTLKKIK